MGQVVSEQCCGNNSGDAETEGTDAVPVLVPSTEIAKLTGAGEKDEKGISPSIPSAAKASESKAKDTKTAKTKTAAKAPAASAASAASSIWPPSIGASNPYSPGFSLVGLSNMRSVPRRKTSSRNPVGNSSLAWPKGASSKQAFASWRTCPKAARSTVSSPDVFSSLPRGPGSAKTMVVSSSAVARPAQKASCLGKGWTFSCSLQISASQPLRSLSKPRRGSGGSSCKATSSASARRLPRLNCGA
mmetsp:Transcript_13396/g.23109  ORF Transcript_13396/g.23109 Transcript_13396/m.23109 type:complete len:245 (-) Transcript_13396:91-825(-)